jgi:hypothetical protein
MPDLTLSLLGQKIDGRFSIKSLVQEDDIKIQMYGEELLEEEEEELALDKEAIVLEEEEESPNAAPPIPNASSFFVFGPKNP